MESDQEYWSRRFLKANKIEAYRIYIIQPWRNAWPSFHL